MTAYFGLGGKECNISEQALKFKKKKGKRRGISISTQHNHT